MMRFEVSAKPNLTYRFGDARIKACSNSFSGSNTGAADFHCGPIAPVNFSRDDLTQPVAPPFALECITDVQSSSDSAYATSRSFGITKMPFIAQPGAGAE
jgi:hypothetical protein